MPPSANRDDDCASAPVPLDTGLLSELSEPEHFGKGRVFGLQGEPCPGVFIIQRGHVLQSRLHPGGDEHALHLLGPGELFGEGALGARPRWLTNVRAATAGTAWQLTRPQVYRLGRHYPRFLESIVALLSRRLEQAYDQADLLSTPNARERLLGFLRLAAASHGEPRGADLWIPLPLKQAELGDLLSLQRETVARSIAALEAEGVLRHRPRQGFLMLSEIG